jgi:hypothetical protein
MQAVIHGLVDQYQLDEEWRQFPGWMAAIMHALDEVGNPSDAWTYSAWPVHPRCRRAASAHGYPIRLMEPPYRCDKISSTAANACAVHRRAASAKAIWQKPPQRIDRATQKSAAHTLTSFRGWMADPQPPSP